MLQKLIAEFTGTFLLVFFGTGAIIIQEQSGVIGHPGVAAAFGLSVFILIMFFAKISGAHFNPAVSISMGWHEKKSVKEISFFIVAQLVGAIASSLLLHILFPTNIMLGATLPAGGTSISFVLEFILTFVLVLGILLISTNKENTLFIVALSIGAIIGLEALMAGPICGASMNPARSLGPALVSGHFEHLWLYVIAPIAGGIFAVLIFPLLNKKEI